MCVLISLRSYQKYTQIFIFVDSQIIIIIIYNIFINIIYNSELLLFIIYYLYSYINIFFIYYYLYVYNSEKSRTTRAIMPVEYYESIKNHVFRGYVMTQKNVHSMSINDKVKLNEQNNSNFVLQKKKSYIYIHMQTYTKMHGRIYIKLLNVDTLSTENGF